MYNIQSNRIIYKNKKVQLMKRPQSAKPGYRAPVLQNSSDDIKDQQFIYKNPQRKQVKLLKPDLTTNDFSRIMPKNIYQDKERLYSEGLQLKQKLNELQQENIRLKTRVSILEKQKDKLTRAIDNAADSGNKSQSRFKVHQGAATDKQSSMLLNFKKIIRESKEQNSYLRQQNAKIKKAMKFTKINEVEIECKILRQQYQKLQQLLIEMNDKLRDQEQYEREIGELKNYLEEEVQANKQLTETNQKYTEYIEELEEKLKTQSKKVAEKEKKLQRELALQKRKLNEEIKVSDDLRKQIKALKQTSPNIDVKKKPILIKNPARPMTSQPYAKHKQQTTNANKQTQKKLDEMMRHNEKLEKQLKEMKLKLEHSEKQNIHQVRKQEVKEKEKSPQKKQQQQSSSGKQGLRQLRVDSQPKQDYEDQKFEDGGFIMSGGKEQKKQSPSKKKKKAQNQENEGFILKQPKNQEEYDDNFDEMQQQKSGSQVKQQAPSSKRAIDAHVAKYNKDLEQDDEEQQLYRKQIKKDNKKDKEKGKKKKTDGTSTAYQPNKEILNQIKQLLTYRMKAQKYPYQELEKDILLANQKQFIYSDLEGVFRTEPFYLSSVLTKAFLEYVFEKKVVKPGESVTVEVLLKKIRKVVKDFEVLDQKQEEQRLMSIAEMTTQYPQQLEKAFEKIKNGPQTVAKKDLVEMFKKLQLADHFIQLIIAELSLCSQDLDHLNIRGFFQRFYLQDMQDDDNAIDQQQIQSSGEMQQTKGKNKIAKIDEEDEYEDDKINFIMDEGELSMRGKGQNNIQNDDIVSDDGHI